MQKPCAVLPSRRLACRRPQRPLPNLRQWFWMWRAGRFLKFRRFFSVLPQPKEATKKAPKKVGQVKKKCLDGRKGAKKRHQYSSVTQDPCSIDLSVLQSHQAPSPILVIDLSELLFHQAPSPILVIDLSELLFHQAPSPILSG